MFKKYPSIENTYRQEILDRILGHGFWEETFVVQEKVHGANLSFITSDGHHFTAAKRTEIIKENEAFYKYDHVLKALQPKLTAIWNTLRKQDPELQQLTVFGELIGGDYPHAEVPVNREAVAVQKGIAYSPNNLFYAFDILLNADRFLSVEEANSLFESEQLLHAKTLFKGSIQDCLKYPNDFDSTIPAELGLPPIQPNTCEGVIIRPARVLRFNNGQRILLKNKNEAWAENKRYQKTIRKEEEVSHKVIQLQEAIQGYITKNRLSNVLSKIGPISSKDFGRVMGLFSKDVVVDFEKDYQDTMEDLDKKERKLITKSIAGSIAALVKQELMNG